MVEIQYYDWCTIKIILVVVNEGGDVLFTISHFKKL